MEPDQSFQIKKREKNQRSRDLGEGIALSPDAAVVAEDGGGGEACAVADVAEEVVVHVRLPRHFFFCFCSPPTIEFL